MTWYTQHLQLAAVVSEWGMDSARRWSESKVKRNYGGGLSLAWPEQTENHEWVQAAEEVGTVETVSTSMVGLRERQGSHWRCPNIQVNFICPHGHTVLARQQLEGTRRNLSLRWTAEFTQSVAYISRGRQPGSAPNLELFYYRENFKCTGKGQYSCGLTCVWFCLESQPEWNSTPGLRSPGAGLRSHTVIRKQKGHGNTIQLVCLWNPLPGRQVDDDFILWISSRIQISLAPSTVKFIVSCTVLVLIDKTVKSLLSPTFND